MTTTEPDNNTTEQVSDNPSSSDWKQVRVSLETWRAVRKFAFDREISQTEVVTAAIEKYLLEASNAAA